MLCDCTQEEMAWADNMMAVNRICLSKSHVLAKPLTISTSTNVFKCIGIRSVTRDGEPPVMAPPPKAVDLSMFVTFITSPSSGEAISKCIVQHLGTRLPLNLKGKGLPGSPDSTQLPSAEPQPSPSKKAKQKGNEDFYNQITMSFNDGTSTKSIKVFNNLTLHVTGCKAPSEARVVATLAWDLLCLVYPMVAHAMYTHNIQMLNATCESNYSFSMRNMHARLKQHMYVNYDPLENQYPGAIAKFPVPSTSSADEPEHTVTIMLFASGNVAFSGKSLRHISLAYAFLLEFLEAEKAHIQSKEPILSKKKQEAGSTRRKYTLKGPRKNARIVHAIVV